jgi:hypothetical protein
LEKNKMQKFNFRSLMVVGMTMLAVGINSIAQDTATPPGYAILEGWAVLPADTFAEGPASGTLINPESNLNGRTVPFESQPVQGVSAIIPASDNTWFILPDNGFGAQDNSADFFLRIYEVGVNFDTQSVEVIRYISLSDPNGVVPFAIVNNDTDDRLLTGQDFDIESFRLAPDGTFWIGDEFGPWLLHFSAEGVMLTAPIATPFPADLESFARGLEFVQAPENPAFVELDVDARATTANHRGSGGFEGMAISPDGTTLFTMLEGVMVDARPDATFGTRLLTQEFSITDMSYNGTYYYYPLTNPSHNIGEMTAINDTQFLVIERDGGFGVNAAFKRVFLVDITNLQDDGHTFNKTLVVDLLSIFDANGLTTAEEGIVGFGPIFKFPFVTIESVYPVDAQTLLVVNDNNYPFSSGRRPGSPDDTEFILVRLPQALNLGE